MNDEDEILKQSIQCKSLPSHFIQVKSTVAYLEKGMSGFYEYIPQQPHAAFEVHICRGIFTTYGEMNTASSQE